MITNTWCRPQAASSTKGCGSVSRTPSIARRVSGLVLAVIRGWHQAPRSEQQEHAHSDEEQRDPDGSGDWSV